MDQKERDAIQLFLPIAVVEHHLLASSALTTYDLAKRLLEVWNDFLVTARSGAMDLTVGCILGINEKIAKACNTESGEFINAADWPGIVEGWGIEEAPEQGLAWIFSSLYWDRLTCCRFSTAWLYTNALRVQYGLPILELTVHRLGPFLESLSGSGPPLYDGQTFIPDLLAPPCPG
jgi:hypothetical protein